MLDAEIEETESVDFQHINVCVLKKNIKIYSCWQMPISDLKKFITYNYSVF